MRKDKTQIPLEHPVEEDVRTPHHRLPSNATPDQTRHNGMRPELAKTLPHADTSGIVELRKRKGNLEGM